MKRPILLAGLKTAVILYFAACASVDDYTVYQSVTPVITKGNWKVNLYRDANADKTNEFVGYVFSFNTNGDVTVTQNGNTINGNWYEDNSAKRVLVSLGSSHPLLTNLNDAWKVTEVSNSNINLECISSATSERLILTNQ